MIDDLFTFQASENLPGMVWGKWQEELFSKLEEYPMIRDKKGIIIWEEVCHEAIKEVCFKVRKKLILPCDESRWCPVAVKVTHNLCMATAKALWPQKQSSSNLTLSQKFLDIAKRIGDKINGLHTSVRLSFNGSFEDPFVRCDMAANDTGKKDQRFIVTKSHLATSCSSEKSTSSLLAGCRTACIKDVNEVADLNRMWYLACQVFFVVDTIAQTTLDGRNAYSQQLLMTTIGLDAGVASLALEKVVLPPSQGRRRVENLGSRSRFEHTFKRPKGSVCNLTATRKATPTESNLPKPTQPQSTLPKPTTNASLFWNVVWPVLQDDHGWTLICGRRPNNFYACPRGVIRGQPGFSRNRIDFFILFP